MSAHGSERRACADTASAGRDVRLDALRGLAVALVVLGHALVRATDASLVGGPGLEAVPGVGFVELATLTSPLLNIVYTLHIPLFAFVAGFVMERSSVGFGGRFLGRRILALVVPYLAWLLVAWVAIGSHTLPGLARFMGAGLVNDQAPGSLWFLYALFVSAAIFAGVHALGSSSGVLALSAVVVGAIGVLPVAPEYQHFLGLSEVAWLYPFVIAGFLAARHRAVLDGWRAGLAVCVGVWLITTPLVWPVLSSADKWWQAGFTAGVAAAGLPGGALIAKGIWAVARVLGALAGSLACYFAYAALKGRPLDLQAWLGKRSLGIYAVHGWFLLTLGLPEGPLRVSGMFALALASSVVLVAVLERIPVVRRLLLGMRR